eukprot:CAMPEP_0172385846 /NCGR_PEP_ID=MMETSP1061-20121228/3456_1 /TAXON_ID=37318 /ORGANISM="Pseudo-nitzschia pungens, Strain cf. pungens" /LENGTH=181 /DNA_ID=CAMNT_0013115003 /DNA_START=103 /DNA_END=648 /DNA_ORIENTATION=-
MESLKKNVADFGTKIRDGAQKFAADHEQEINSAKAKAGEWKAKAAGALKKGNRQAKPEDEGDSAAAEAAADSAGREQEPSANTTTSTTTTTTGASGRWKPGFAAVDKEAIADALRRAKAKVKVFGRTPASTEPETADAATAAATTAAATTAAADTSDSAGGNGSIGTEGGETGVAEAPVQA